MQPVIDVRDLTKKFGKFTAVNSINFKIRKAQLEKVPYMLILGDKEVAGSTVSVRLRNGEQLNDQALDSFKELVNTANDSKTIDAK